MCLASPAKASAANGRLSSTHTRRGALSLDASPAISATASKEARPCGITRRKITTGQVCERRITTDFRYATITTWAALPNPST